MPVQAKPLTPLKVSKARYEGKQKKLFDGDGLFLLVTKSSKLWRMKYYFDGKENTYSLGKYDGEHNNIDHARAERKRLKGLIANGINPNEARKEAKEQKQAEELRTQNTYEKIAKAYLEKRHELNEAYLIRLQRAFENDVIPFIGKKPIDEVTPKEIIEIVKRVQQRGAIESAHRLFTQISKVFKYAVSNQLCTRNPCADMDKNEVLKSFTRKNYPTITDPKQIGVLLNLIEEYSGDYTTRMALKIAPLVFLRPFNLRHAEWSEIDFEDCLWRIPAEKMKTKKEHIVPLSEQMLAIFQEMQTFSGDAKYIFHSLRSKFSPMSDATLNGALRRMGYSKDELVVHGFRAMFSTIAHEKSGFKHEVIETQLAHSVGNSVSQAYNRAMYLDERKELMQWWSDYLDGIKDGK